MAAAVRQGALPARRWPPPAEPREWGREWGRAGAAPEWLEGAWLSAWPFPQRAAVELMGSPPRFALPLPRVSQQGPQRHGRFEGSGSPKPRSGATSGPELCPRTGNGAGNTSLWLPRQRQRGVGGERCSWSDRKALFLLCPEQSPQVYWERTAEEPTCTGTTKAALGGFSASLSPT